MTRWAAAQLRGFAKVLLAPGRRARVAVGSSSRQLRAAGGVDPAGAGTQCR